MNIVLIGMMGSGKTSVGKKLSKLLSYEFVDTDEHIERGQEMSITDIVNSKGEEYFRKIEEKLSLNFLEKNKCVIAFGGGAFMNEKIRKKIKKNSYSFWLNWKIKTILDRISKNKNRPLALKLNDKDLVNLYTKRIKFYKLSNFKVNCENKNKSEIIRNIFKLLTNEDNSN